MHWLTGDWSSTGAVAAKAALMYVVALIALRLGDRRTVSQWTIIDFATSVALGAIIGRTAVAGKQSLITGVVATITLVVVHRLMSTLRYKWPVARLVDHRVRVLVDHGAVREHELRKTAVTRKDLFAHLRLRGVFSLDDIRYVLYETSGELTIVPERGRFDADPPLVRSALEASDNYP